MNGTTRAAASGPTSSIAATGKPVGFAALAETWMGPNGEEVDTVAIITAPASADLARLHPRVPVTISPDAFERWLDCSADDVVAGDAAVKGPAIGESRLA